MQFGSFSLDDNQHMMKEGHEHATATDLPPSCYLKELIIRSWNKASWWGLSQLGPYLWR